MELCQGLLTQVETDIQDTELSYSCIYTDKLSYTQAIYTIEPQSWYI